MNKHIVYYKYRGETQQHTINIGSSSILAENLKSLISQRDQISEDLKLKYVNTNAEYKDNHPVREFETVIVLRGPGRNRKNDFGANNNNKKKVWVDKQQRQRVKQSGTTEITSINVLAQENNDITDDMDEDEKQLAFLNMSHHENIRRNHKVPNDNYVCNICGEKGHFKQNCPRKLNDPNFDENSITILKQPAGIPRAQMIPISEDEVKGSSVMSLGGEFLKIRSQSNRTEIKEENIPSKESITCPICKKIFVEAVKLMCCNTTCCAACSDILVESDNPVCPNCGKKVDEDEIHIDERARSEVERYKRYEKKLGEQGLNNNQITLDADLAASFIKSNNQMKDDSPKRNDRHTKRNEAPPRRKEATTRQSQQRRNSPPPRRAAPPRRKDAPPRQSQQRRNSPPPRQSQQRRNSPPPRREAPPRRNSPPPRRTENNNENRRQVAPPRRNTGAPPRRSVTAPRRNDGNSDRTAPRRKIAPPARDSGKSRNKAAPPRRGNGARNTAPPPRRDTTRRSIAPPRRNVAPPSRNGGTERRVFIEGDRRRGREHDFDDHDRRDVKRIRA